MDNPGQFLIHVTNRGPAVFSTTKGGMGEFKVMAKQPLKDINKFGLLHYSIPKMCDATREENFFLQIQYGDGTSINVPVRMPNLDYYNMLTTQLYDTSGAGYNYVNHRIKDQLALDEVLQTVLNWSIMEHYEKLHTNHRAGQVALTWGELLLCRVSVIVKINHEGQLEVTCGYRGAPAQADYENLGTLGQKIPSNVQPENNSGNPTQSYFCCLPGGTYVNNTQLQGPDEAVLDSKPLGDAAMTDDKADGARITAVGFARLSMRMQLLLGAGSDAEVMSEHVGNNEIRIRGRVMLKSYTLDANTFSGLVKYTAAVQPNLDPPSFIYLQMTVPGTRSKILGMSDERGGWAVPTPPNEYMSNFINFPLGGARYHKKNARYLPVASDVANYNTYFSNIKDNENGIGFNFDPIPIDPHAGIAQGLNAVKNRDNYNITAGRNISMSRMMRIGGCQEKPEFKNNPMSRFHRGGDLQQGNQGAGFGTGPFRRSAVFTVSLIEPNFIFTSTENATMQTFDVRLMWGDTSEEVRGIAGNPVQFSIIASP